jgi:hypothetical protein
MVAASPVDRASIIARCFSAARERWKRVRGCGETAAPNGPPGDQSPRGSGGNGFAAGGKSLACLVRPALTPKGRFAQPPGEYGRA